MTTAGMMRSSSALTLSYVGPALMENGISVRDLASALGATGDLFDRSSYLVFGGDVTNNLMVTTTRRSSFEIELLLQVEFSGTNLLTSSLVVSALNLRQIAVTAIDFFKRLRGSSTPVTHPIAERAAAVDYFTVRIGDFETHTQGSSEVVQTIAQDVLKVVKDPQFLSCVQRMVEPVQRDGFDEVVIKENARELASVRKDELRLFIADPDDGYAGDLISTEKLQIISPNLGGRNSRWRLRGSNKINWYSISDERFLDEVKRGLRRFAHGDILECNVRTIYEVTEEGTLRAHLEILKVIEQTSVSEYRR